MRSWLDRHAVILTVGTYGVAAVCLPVVAVKQFQPPPEELDYYYVERMWPIEETSPKYCAMPEDTELALLELPTRQPAQQPGFELAMDVAQTSANMQDELYEPKDLTPLVTSMPKPRPKPGTQMPADPPNASNKARLEDKTLVPSKKRTVTGNGGKLILEPRTMRMFQQLEKAWGEKLTVRWAYRDRKLNKRVGGASRSMHLKKQAIDIVHGGWSKAKMARFVRLAYKIGFRGFGLGRNVVHIDTRKGLASWNYGGNRYGTASRMLR